MSVNVVKSSETCLMRVVNPPLVKDNNIGQVKETVTAEDLNIYFD